MKLVQLMHYTDDGIYSTTWSVDDDRYEELSLSLGVPVQTMYVPGEHVRDMADDLTDAAEGRAEITNWNRPA